MPIRTHDVLRHYRSLYRALAPDTDSVLLAKDIWEAWEQSGIAPPDVDAIAKNHMQHENGFFYDIVRVAEKMEHRPLNIHYCAFCLDQYNFYAFSTDDGYIVLIDDNFFQLLFFLSMLLVFDAQGLIEEAERAEAQALTGRIIWNNYFMRQRFDFSQDEFIPRLFRRDYELTEFANYFFHALKAFIIAHEIGHHVLGHTSGQMLRVFSMQGHQQAIEVDERQITDEYAADHYGYRLFDLLSNTVDESIYYAYCKYKFPFAPLLLFNLFAKLDDITATVRGEFINYRTHPAPAQRIAALELAYSIDKADPLYVAMQESLERLFSGEEVKKYVGHE